MQRDDALRRRQGRCVFCRGTRLGKEHVFADWLKPLVRGSGHRTQAFARYNRPDSQGRATKEHRDRQGDVATLHVRVVCEACNSGWMSGIEQRAKPHLTALIRDQDTRLGKGASKAIALWAAKTRATIDYVDHQTRAVPAEHRQWIMERREPPPYTSVWLGRQDFRVSVEVRGRALFVADDPEKVGMPRVEPCNTYMTSFAMGRLHLMLLGTTVQSVASLEPAGRLRDSLIRLWPSPQELRWPPPGTISQSDLAQAWDGYISAFRQLAFTSSTAPEPENWPI